MNLGAQFREKQSRHIGVRIGHAEQIRADVRSVAEDVMALMGLNPVLAFDSERVKEGGRALQKFGCESRNMGDLFGVRILFDNPNALAKLNGLKNPKHPLVQKWANRTRSIRIHSIDDYHERPKPHGYTATHINLLVKGNNGWEEASELQTFSRDVKHTYDDTVPYYRAYRTFMEHAEMNGRHKPSEWLPEERSVILALRTYIRARFEEKVWETGLINFRKGNHVSGSIREARETVAGFQNEADAVRNIIECYQDPEQVLDFYASMKQDVPHMTELSHSMV